MVSEEKVMMKEVKGACLNAKVKHCHDVITS